MPTWTARRYLSSIFINILLFPEIVRHYLYPLKLSNCYLMDDNIRDEDV